MRVQPKPQGKFSELLPVMLQTGVGIVVLLVIWLVVSNLPMLARLPFPTKFTLGNLLAAIVLTVAAGMLISFGLRMEGDMARLIKPVPSGWHHGQAVGCHPDCLDHLPGLPPHRRTVYGRFELALSYVISFCISMLP